LIGEVSLPKHGGHKVSDIKAIRNNFETQFNKIISDYAQQDDKDVFFSASISLLNQTLLALKSTLNETPEDIVKFLKTHNFDKAEKKYLKLLAETKALFMQIQNTNDKCAEITINNVEDLDSTQKLYQKRLKSFEREWKRQKQKSLKMIKEIKTEINNSFDQWIIQSRHDIKTQISKLNSLFSTFQKKLSTLPELMERKQFKQANKILENAFTRIENELNYQNERITEISDDLTPLLGDLISKWQHQIEQIEIKIQEMVLPVKSKVDIEILREKISDLDPFYETIQKRLLSLFSLIKHCKLADVEKALKSIKEEVETKFSTYEQEFSEEYKTNPNYLNELIKIWKIKLKDTKTKIQQLVSIAQNAFNKAYKPHLTNKLDLFIDQNLEAMTHLIDDFKIEAMNQIRSLLDKPNQELLDFLITQKKKIAKDLNNREKHVHLVFNRYNDFEIDEQKEKWNTEFKKVQDHLSEIKTKIFNLIEFKAEINSSIESYYAMANPAYGYKVPIKVLSEKLEISEDKLENLFVELISSNFLTGEIDPITKVIVLAPRVVSEQQAPRKAQIIRCIVCNLIINPAKEELIYCPHCNSPAHRSHLIEWIKIKGFCPKCKKDIKIF